MSDKDNPTDREIADVLRGLDPNPNTLVRNFEVEFQRIRCPDCDIHFYVPKFWYAKRKESHVEFCCPNRHLLYFKKPA